MHNEEIENIMIQAGVRISAVRLLILKAIAEADCPLSALELESRLESVDRSSITRALSLFMEHGLLHAVADGNFATRYELCQHNHDASDSGHSDHHVHFHCLKCGVTECLNDTQVPKVMLPAGYTEERINYVITGLCAKCAHKE